MPQRLALLSLALATPSRPSPDRSQGMVSEFIHCCNLVCGNRFPVVASRPQRPLSFLLSSGPSVLRMRSGRATGRRLAFAVPASSQPSPGLGAQQRCTGLMSALAVSWPSPSQSSSATALGSHRSGVGHGSQRKSASNTTLNRTANGMAPWPRGALCISCAARPGHHAVVGRLAPR